MIITTGRYLVFPSVMGSAYIAYFNFIESFRVMYYSQSILVLYTTETI